MKSSRVIYHLARADFLERVRRYSFLVMLGLASLLGYQTAVGNVRLQLGDYRGEFNSAWVGGMMSIIATFFIGWFGFYLVKGSVARDRETGVGQIMATTPMTRPLYTLGKWISNFAVLMLMVVILAIFGIVIQFLSGESMQVNLSAYLLPFVFIVMPLMALVAAVAVLFEAIPFLSGGFGNIVYFFGFIMMLPFIMEQDFINTYPAIEPMGLALLKADMAEEVIKVFPDYGGSFMLGGMDTPIIGTFTWTGIEWTPAIIATRFAFIGLAILLTLLAAIFFDRFDPSRAKPKRIKSIASDSAPAPASTSQALPTPRLTPLNAAANGFSFSRVLVAELKLLLKGQRWWWYIAAAGLIIACFANPSATTREIVLPMAWIWPILIWSAIGNREIHNNVQQLTFSSASPLMRQLPAQWIAGFLVTLFMSSGAILRYIIDGDTVGLLALLSGAFFIPSLALASGVWSGTSKLFEILYMVIWYLGPLNKVPGLDFIGSHSNGNPQIFIPFSIALIASAIFGRSRQLRN
ncbi:ABC transporter permease subunit [Candidatus Villigracilis affinis]|uniref:ABC transporter permease n=1 Tax=Candidatus Villigracilis affinis TaxID=3140682 RepID=UPI002A234772|nr:ABC transporter permease subunit [Anaerolineales bacterium]